VGDHQAGKGQVGPQIHSSGLRRPLENGHDESPVAMSTYGKSTPRGALGAPVTGCMSIYGKTAIYDEHLTDLEHVLGAHCGLRCSCCSWQRELSIYGGRGLRNRRCGSGLDDVAQHRATRPLPTPHLMPPGYGHRCNPNGVKGLPPSATKPATKCHREWPFTANLERRRAFYAAGKGRGGTHPLRVHTHSLQSHDIPEEFDQLALSRRRHVLRIVGVASSTNAFTKASTASTT
jgi:hypothetical protein